MCHQLIFSLKGLGNHQCPPEARAKKEAELDMVIEEELSTWNADLKKFWNDPRTKFYKYLAEQERD